MRVSSPSVEYDNVLQPQETHMQSPEVDLEKISMSSPSVESDYALQLQEKVGSPSVDHATQLQEKVASLYSILPLDACNENDEFLSSVHLLRMFYKRFEGILISSGKTTTKPEYIHPCCGDSADCLQFCVKQNCLSITKCQPCTTLHHNQIKRQSRKEKSVEEGVDRTSHAS
jgi:hypothetical protein